MMIGRGKLKSYINGPTLSFDNFYKTKKIIIKHKLTNFTIKNNDYLNIFK